jgi:hypothetical protein
MKIHTIGSDIYASQPSNAMMPPLPSLPPPPEIEASLEEEKVFQCKGEVAIFIPHKMTKVEVHPSVTKILDNAFNNCPELKSLVPYNRLKEFGTSSFGYCIYVIGQNQTDPQFQIN